MNKHYWIKEMEKWVNNMTPKEKLEFDKGVEEMKTEMFVNVVKTPKGKIGMKGKEQNEQTLLDKRNGKMGQ